MPQDLTDYHAKYYAHELTRRHPPDSADYETLSDTAEEWPDDEPTEPLTPDDREATSRVCRAATLVRTLEEKPCQPEADPGPAESETTVPV